ncbi:serine/threonine-protein kinase H1 homolog [Parasteatoda tepidariorum]|uniref:serine/threonine-protein kinase H1 homolog n=1 Tax=Parasteatoda tepidariorum TaxID=114398 RepID=UPI00077FC647|nr:serine/threonine-protein kinase H1 homolog [Parasteatoda tepidariorum]
MGCSVGKLDSRKFNDPNLIGAKDMKIQTVLQLKAIKDTKSIKDGKTMPKSTRNRRHRHDSCPRKKGDVCKKSPRIRTEKAPKPTYDSKITAKYDIKAVIGKGSFSRVLRVEHRQTKQPYALKIIEAPGGREAFEAELSVLRRLNHSNVIKLIEVFESDHKVYMVMELATGGSLLDRLEARGYLAEEDSREVLRMVLSGVKYLHGLGITHRDLKPDNLLYYHPGKESKIMITDFSFASTRRATGNPYMHTVCGTPQYIAPEIVARKPYTSAVDIWAVGVITYIVLCGVFPFDAEHDAQIFKLILRGQIDMSSSIWCDISEESKLFVHQLLQTDPSNRLNAEAALQHEWLMSSKLTYTPSPKSNHGGHKSDHRSQRSSRSVGSSKSGGSVHSLRVSGHRRVQVHLLEALSSDPEVAAMM